MHSVYDDEVGLSSPILAAYSLLIVLSAPFLGWAKKWKVAKGNCCCTNHPDLAHLRTKADEA